MDARSLHGLVSFVAVAEHGSFSAAARVLGVSTSAVSQTMRRLEERVGGPLFTRTTRSLHLTDVGTRLLDEVGAAVKQSAAAIERARAAPGEVTGTLRLNLSRMSVPTMRPLIATYLGRHARVTVEVAVDDRFVDIVRGGFDAGVRLGEAVPADMIAVPLSGPIRFVVVGAPSYFQARGKPRTPDDLTSHACIGWKAPSSGALYRWELERGSDAVVVDLRGPLVCDDSEVMMGAAVDGVGLAYLPEPAVESLIRAGQLEVVLEDWAPRGPGLSLYFAKRAQAVPKLRAFVDLLREQRRGRGRRPG